MPLAGRGLALCSGGGRGRGGNPGITDINPILSLNPSSPDVPPLGAIYSFSKAYLGPVQRLEQRAAAASPINACNAPSASAWAGRPVPNRDVMWRPIVLIKRRWLGRRGTGCAMVMGRIVRPSDREPCAPHDRDVPGWSALVPNKQTSRSSGSSTCGWAGRWKGFSNCRNHLPNRAQIRLSSQFAVFRVFNGTCYRPQKSPDLRREWYGGSGARREWDLNPRGACTPKAFQEPRIRPLCHPSMYGGAILPPNPPGAPRPTSVTSRAAAEMSRRRAS